MLRNLRKINFYMTQFFYKRKLLNKNKWIAGKKWILLHLHIICVRQIYFKMFFTHDNFYVYQDQMASIL